jgi:protein TonB
MFTPLIESTEEVRTRRSLSLTLAVVVHLILILLLLLLPLLAPEPLAAQLQHLTVLITPPPPPPSRSLAPPGNSQFAVKNVIHDNTIRVPREIPRRIEFVTDEAPPQLPAGDVSELIPGGAQNGVLYGVLGAPSKPLAAPSPPPLPRAANMVHRVQVSGGLQQARLISQLKPQYPPRARQAGIQGAVVLEAIISKEGTVMNVNVISGHPFLIPAALDAVRQWKYKPTLLNNEPVEVVTNITMNFSLGG